MFLSVRHSIRPKSENAAAVVLAPRHSIRSTLEEYCCKWSQSTPQHPCQVGKYSCSCLILLHHVRAKLTKYICDFLNLLPSISPTLKECCCRFLRRHHSIRPGFGKYSCVVLSLLNIGRSRLWKYNCISLCLRHNRRSTLEQYSCVFLSLLHSIRAKLETCLLSQSTSQYSVQVGRIQLCLFSVDFAAFVPNWKKTAVLFLSLLHSILSKLESCLSSKSTSQYSFQVGRIQLYLFSVYSTVFVPTWKAVFFLSRRHNIRSKLGEYNCMCSQTTSQHSFKVGSILLYFPKSSSQQLCQLERIQLCLFLSILPSTHSELEKYSCICLSLLHSIRSKFRKYSCLLSQSTSSPSTSDHSFQVGKYSCICSQSTSQNSFHVERILVISF